MVFGRTYSERREKAALRAERSQTWHKSFALVPHYLDDGRMVWLQWCERRFLAVVGDYGAWCFRLASEPKEGR